jgi:hypothetical protein
MRETIDYAESNLTGLGLNLLIIRFNLDVLVTLKNRLTYK